MNRSRLVFLISAALILAGAVLLFPAEERTASRKPLEPLTLAVAADLHYIAPELTDGGAYFTRIVENGDGKAMAYCKRIQLDTILGKITQNIWGGGK